MGLDGLVTAAQVKSWSTALFGTTEAKKKRAQHEKELELRVLPNIWCHPNIGEHDAEVTDSQPLARLSASRSRTLAEPVHVNNLKEFAMFEHLLEALQQDNAAPVRIDCALPVAPIHVQSRVLSPCHRLCRARTNQI